MPWAIRQRLRGLRHGELQADLRHRAASSRASTHGSWCSTRRHQCLVRRGKGLRDRRAGKRIGAAKLDAVVEHRGSSCPSLERSVCRRARCRSGRGSAFTSPGRGPDIPAYLVAGRKKTKVMSTMQFGLLDRVILTPMEINPAMSSNPWLASACCCSSGSSLRAFCRQRMQNGLPFVLLGWSRYSPAPSRTALLPGAFAHSRSRMLVGMQLSCVRAVLRSGSAAGHHAARSRVRLLSSLELLHRAQFTGSTTFTACRSEEGIEDWHPSMRGAAASLVWCDVQAEGMEVL